MPTPRVAIGPTTASPFATAVRDGGGAVVELGASADALVWLSPVDVGGLRAALAADPGIQWVQLPFAGVEAFAAEDVFSDGRTWTCAKGVYAEPVAEHALALALAGLRCLPERITATSWGRAKGETLHDADVTIVGGGGITEVLLSLLAPFRANVTVVRRRPDPLPGAHRVVGTDALDEAIPGARVVFLALALTPATRGLIAAPQLELMDSDAWLVNVARGGHVVTADLVAALEHDAIGGAALDVTDPEPLPDGHPLWTLPNAIITPHTADWPEIVTRLLAARVRANVERFAAGRPLLGLVDPVAGY